MFDEKIKECMYKRVYGEYMATKVINVAKFGHKNVCAINLYKNDDILCSEKQNLVGGRNECLVRPEVWDK